jgi:hypothetical protein
VNPAGPAGGCLAERGGKVGFGSTGAATHATRTSPTRPTRRCGAGRGFLPSQPIVAYDGKVYRAAGGSSKLALIFSISVVH